MECRLFFALLTESRKLRAQEWVNDCYITAIAIGDKVYFEKQVEFYKSLVPMSPEEMLRIHEEAEAAVVSGQEAKEAMTALFGK